MATIAAHAPSTHQPRLQTGARRLGKARAWIETWLEAERDQLPLWLPVALGAGTTAWFQLPGPTQWLAALLLLAAVASAATALGQQGRAGRAVAAGAVVAAAGLTLAWVRAERVAAPVLSRPAIVAMTAKVIAVETLPARELVRVRLAPMAVNTGPAGAGRDARPAPIVPPAIRINLAQEDAPAGLGVGAVVSLRVRLMPPPEPAVPGAYDYARVAWFDGIGATGRGLAPVRVIAAGPGGGDVRAALSRHIQAMAPGSAGGIASALVTGDEGAIAEDDADAMRRSGLAHLLSVSGLHITAVVTATIVLVTRLLALFPAVALRVRVPMAAAGAGAAAAIGYTLLTGSQVPTMRSCIAALLVLAALSIGREAITLRLVAAGAFVVLLVWPDALAGPSFQLSFAAVTAIVALHEAPAVRSWFAARDEPLARRMARHVASLLLTGMVVEAALAPIALYHFHKAGLYGALANIIAIPLTTFVIMPAEALALAADAVGIGAPFWWVTRLALALLLWIAHMASGAAGSLAMLPAMPNGAFGLMAAGALWLGLWRTRLRTAGLIPLLIGALWALATPPPDLIVTGDGRHLAIRTAHGGLVLLRDRAGDYTRSTLAENAGVDGEPLALDSQPFARCSRDLCLADIRRGGGRWRIVATRSAYQLPAAALIAACRGADIVVSDRRLPRGCTPRWLRLDAPVLRRTGGIAITLDSRRIATVRTSGDRHPWRADVVSRSAATSRQAAPEREPGRGRNAEDRRRGWPDRAGSSRPRGGNI